MSKTLKNSGLVNPLEKTPKHTLAAFVELGDPIAETAAAADPIKLPQTAYVQTASGRFIRCSVNYASRTVLPQAKSY